VAVETRLHGRFDDLVVDVRLDGVAGSASDRIRCQVVVSVVEYQGRGTITRPYLVDVEVTLRAPDELGIADDGCGWRRQLVG
jgi:hypothetical protein